MMVAPEYVFIAKRVCSGYKRVRFYGTCSNLSLPSTGTMEHHVPQVFPSSRLNTKAVIDLAAPAWVAWLNRTAQEWAQLSTQHDNPPSLAIKKRQLLWAGSRYSH